MHIELTPEAILNQLDYTYSTTLHQQVDKIISNTKNFDKFSKHFLTLKDNLKHINGFIALSNNNDLFKIKIEPSESKNFHEEFHEIVNKWSDKYNIELQKVENKDVYYILGAS